MMQGIYSVTKGAIINTTKALPRNEAAGYSRECGIAWSDWIPKPASALSPKTSRS
jgi:hypothetical protein